MDLDYFKVKIIADILWYISGFLAWYLSYKYYFKKHLVSIPFRNLEEKLFYYLWILAWAMFFAWFVSTLDWYLLKWFPDGIVLSKTVAWAIAGWVISSEIIKKIYNHDFNRGVLFVPSLTIWIIVGRVGAFLIWLRDNTHGLETTLPWWYDYGDGILRHPSQIYEIIVLLTILIIFIIWIKYKKDWWITNWFFIFTLLYFTYRFLVWFVMPYSHFWFGMNTIQVVSVGMIIYSVYKLMKYNYGK
jgi:prolipoprotein diacylglyceryltransferase